MARGAARTAEKVADTVSESVTESVKSVIDRLVEAELTKQIARRGQEVAAILAERGTDVGERAGDAWRDSQPMRRDAAKRVARASGEAAKWSEGMWRSSLFPALRDLWGRRTVAIGAAGAAVPVGRELIDEAAVRIGLKERQQREERRRWGAFFLGLLIGAASGAIVALLTTPRRGSEMRRELGERADEVRRELGVRADEWATRAREAEWMPVFQREGEGEPGNGRTIRGGPAAAGGSTGTRPSGGSGTSARSRGTGSAAPGTGTSQARGGTGSAGASRTRGGGSASTRSEGGRAPRRKSGDQAANDAARKINDAYNVDESS